MSIEMKILKLEIDNPNKLLHNLKQVDILVSRWDNTKNKESTSVEMLCLRRHPADSVIHHNAIMAAVF